MWIANCSICPAVSLSILIVVLLLLEFCRFAENLYFKGCPILQIVIFSDCSRMLSRVSDGWYFNTYFVGHLFVCSFAMHLLMNIYRTPKKTNLLHVISAGGESASSSHVRPHGVSSAVPASSPFRPVWVRCNMFNVLSVTLVALGLAAFCWCLVILASKVPRLPSSPIWCWPRCSDSLQSGR